MNLEIETQIKHRIKEIKRLLKALPDGAALHYREVLSDEIIRLRKELTEVSPLDNQLYLSEDEQSGIQSNNENAHLNEFDYFDNFSNGNH